MVRRQVGRTALRCLQDLKNAQASTTSRGVSSSARDGLPSVTAGVIGTQNQQKRSIGLPAQEEAYDEPVIDFSKKALPINVDRVGAVSVLVDEEDQTQSKGVYENRDGFRLEDGRYAAFTKVEYVTLLCSSIASYGGDMHMLSPDART